MTTNARDYRNLVRMPAYQALVRAVDDFRNTLTAAEVHMSDRDFFALVDRITRLQPYVDYCARCQGTGVSTGAAVFDTSAPYRLKTAADDVVASYTCASCGHQWDTAWARFDTGDTSETR